MGDNNCNGPDACQEVARLRKWATTAWSRGYRMGLADSQRMVEDMKRRVKEIEEKMLEDNARFTEAMLQAEQTKGRGK